MQIDLPVIWAAIIGLGVFIYVMLDGFDLGIGLLFPFFEDERRPGSDDRIPSRRSGTATRLFSCSAAPGFTAPFPVVVFDAAAGELSAPHPDGGRPDLPRRGLRIACEGYADPACVGPRVYGGSALAALCQGIVLGSLLQGIRIVDGRFAGGPFDWLSPFSLFCGIGVLFTYATLGCGWLILKTEGELQRNMRSVMRCYLWLLPSLPRSVCGRRGFAGGCASLVRQRRSRLVSSRSRSRLGLCMGNFPIAAAAPRSDAVRTDSGGVLSRLQRTLDQHLAVHRSARTDDLGSVVESREPAVCAGRHS